MKKIYEKEEGIASTVGTIFALMIFTALLGMFMTQVVPVTMKENEAEHDRQVLSQFSTLRSMIDILTLTKDTNYTAYVPIKMGADGIPFFASPTYGQLSLYPKTAGTSGYSMSLNFTDKYGNDVVRNGSGSVQFIAPNKYYVPEVFEYANGAIMRYNYQVKNAVFAINPNIKFESIDEGYALKFNQHNYVNCGDISYHDWAGLTVEAWIYWTGKTNNGYAGVYFKGVSGIGRFMIYKTGRVLVQNGNGNFWSNESGDIPKNKWTHIAYVYDQNAGKEYIIINGVIKGEKSRHGSISQNDYNLLIGYGYGDDSYYSFDGFIDEFRVLDRALTPEEVEADYLAGAHYPFMGGTVAWYHFDKGTGSTAVDSSAHHHNGTLEGTPPPTWVQRKGLRVSVNLQNIFGTPSSITGTSTRSIAISLQGVYTESFKVGSDFKISLKDYYHFSSGFSFDFTNYWINYITGELNNTGIDYTISGNTISISSVEEVNINTAYIIIGIES